MSNSFDQERRELRRSRWIKPGVWHPADRFSREAKRRLRQGATTTLVITDDQGQERIRSNHEGVVLTGGNGETLLVAGTITAPVEIQPEHITAASNDTPQPGIPASKLLTGIEPEPEPKPDQLTPQQKLAARRARQNEKRKLERAAARS